MLKNRNNSFSNSTINHGGMAKVLDSLHCDTLVLYDYVQLNVMQMVLISERYGKIQNFSNE